MREVTKTDVQASNLINWMMQQTGDFKIFNRNTFARMGIYGSEIDNVLNSYLFKYFMSRFNIKIHEKGSDDSVTFIVGFSLEDGSWYLKRMFAKKLSKIIKHFADGSPYKDESLRLETDYEIVHKSGLFADYELSSYVSDNLTKQLIAMFCEIGFHHEVVQLGTFKTNVIIQGV